MSTCKQLEGKVAIVTGANRGIGKTILELFVQNGATVYGAAREVGSLTSLIESYSQEYEGKIIPLYFDLTQDATMKSAIENLIKNKVKVDILVNNAGVAHGGLLQMTSITKMREIFEVNFFSQMRLIQLVIKLMKLNSSSSIINIGSIAGIDSYPGYTSYGSSKAALIYATKSLSKELSQINIRVNAVAPGLTETDMALQMETKAKSEMINSSALKRMALKDEIAETVLFLASEKSNFINGQIIRVDGGI
jgi:3-oxoacyl-[acyl-carrier protein] reductase